MFKNLFVAFLLFVSFLSFAANTEQELKEYWQQLSTTVEQGDFKGYSALYHQDAILVSGFSNNSYEIAKALDRWEQGFIDTKAGKMKAGVKFIWHTNKVSENTAHQEGIFNYYTVDGSGKKEHFIAHLSALLVKKDGDWLMMMENQKKPASEEEWQRALNKHSAN